MNASLQATTLIGANLMDAYLVGTHLEEADLRGANLEGADLLGAYLGGATYDKNTVWPDGFNPKEAGAILVNEWPFIS